MPTKRGAFKGRIKEILFTNIRHKGNVEYALLSCRKKLKSSINHYLKRHKNVKFQLAVQVRLSKYHFIRHETVYAVPWFTTVFVPVFSKVGLEKKVLKSIAKILAFYDNFISHGSGWILQRVLKIRLLIVKYQAWKGGSPHGILPTIISRKRSLVNIKCFDNKCFAYSVLAGILPPRKSNAARVQSYKEFLPLLDFTGIEFPVSLEKVPLFEERNKISVNVFALDDETHAPYPLYITSWYDFDKHVNLLLYKQHYYWIKGLSGFLSTIHQNRAGHYIFYCRFCLGSFRSQNDLIAHTHLCKAGQVSMYKMPMSKTYMHFENYVYCTKQPWVIYCDFETYVQPMDDRQATPKTRKTAKLVPNAFGAITVCSCDRYTTKPFVYVGDDCMKQFYKYLFRQQNKIFYILKHKRKPMRLDSNVRQELAWQSHCRICGKRFKPCSKTVIDHDHLDGRVRGKCHSICNLTRAKLGSNSKISVFLHNFQHFDGHLLVSELKRFPHLDVHIIPKNTETYLSVSFNNIFFKDSFAHLPGSLETLTKSLFASDPSAFKLSQKKYGDNPHFKLLLGKSPYPYNFVRSYEAFKCTELPPRSAFYNDLLSEPLSEEDYLLAQKIWDAFHCKTLLDYTKLYLTMDVLLLADIFESWRSKCLSFYGLDPSYYLSAAQYSMDAALKFTGIHLELLRDYEMHTFFEEGIRGGIVSAVTKYARANNRYMPDFDKSKPENYLMYFDCVNLYGYAMCKELPYKGFTWLTDEEVDTFDIFRTPAHGTGYVLSVQLMYPPEFHDEHNQYPLAPEKLAVRHNMISPYSANLLKKLGLPFVNGAVKLCPNLRDKDIYIAHIENIRFYVEMGLKLVKIHRILKFKQKPWLAKFIKFNAKKRSLATTPFESDLLKNVNNSVFGKTMENVKKRVDIRLVQDEHSCQKLFNKPTFHAAKIFDQNLVGVQMKRACVPLNKPLYTGMAILDLSKLYMYRFFYLYLKNKFHDAVSLVYTDTDSFVLQIYCGDIYQEMYEDRCLFDTSNYPRDHFLFSEKNKKVVGKFKDELGGAILTEAVALRSKAYSLLTQEAKEIKASKGVKKSAMRNIHHQDYVMCFLNDGCVMSSFKCFRSISHKLYTVEITKLGLSPYDDKRYICADGIRTLAYGHRDIKRLERKRGKNPMR